MRNVSNFKQGDLVRVIEEPWCLYIEEGVVISTNVFVTIIPTKPGPESDEVLGLFRSYDLEENEVELIDRLPLFGRRAFIKELKNA